MTELTVRRLQVDLTTPWPRHWAGGDAFRSAWFNALSFSFPAGEQQFIDAVKLGLAQLDAAGRVRFEREVQAFIGQEATHRHVHARYNAQLQAQGYANRWEARIRRRIERRLVGRGARSWLGVTAATEHLTAIFADHLLAHPALLADAEPRLRNLWLWHASEESEHRCTAFDLYRALGGNEKWRRRLYFLVTMHFVIDLTRQTLNNLWHDGHWRRAATWRSAWRLLGARGSLGRALWRPWWRYLAADFHPSQGDGSAGRQWLAAHAALAPPAAARPVSG